MSFAEMKERINAGFPFDVNIPSPYKLTDFKPAYGTVFEELLTPYDYWGYCDLDMIFGDIIKFVEAPMCDGKDKIYQLGHLTIYKNTESMRTLFMQKGAKFSYKTVFTNPELYSFDEHCGQMLIAKHQSVAEYCAEDMADISCRTIRLTASRQKNYDDQVFYYENGKVYRAYLEQDNVRTQEYVYIHMQKRKYTFEKEYSCYYILSDRFAEKQPGIPSAQEIKAYSEFVSREDDHLQMNSYRQMKKAEFFSCSLKKKWIWIHQKIAERQF